MLFNFKNCKCIGCNTNLTKKIYLNITFNWKTIKCDKCSRVNEITIPEFSYNSFFYGFPIGVLCGYVWYIDIFDINIKILVLFLSFILFMFIYTTLLIKKITLY